MFYDDLNTEEQVSYLIKPILQVLQEAGGQLERSEIRDRISELDEHIAEFEQKLYTSNKTGNQYKKFDFKFNFAIKELSYVGLISYVKFNPKITLTQDGANVDLTDFDVKTEVRDGIPGRPRLFEVVQKVKEANNTRRWKALNRTFTGSSDDSTELNANPALEIDYIVAPPRMAYYLEYSTKIYSVYLKYIAPEDIFPYSIDEVFIDATNYLNTYQMTARELAMTMIQDVLKTTGITATAGIGTNMYLCKIAMDIVAKHIEPDKDGVRIAELDEMSYRRQLWNHRPLTDFWRVGKGYAKKLEEHGLFTMGDIARCSIGKSNELYNEELLYKLFGINAELLIDHAWGYEPCTMEQVKAYKPETNSVCSGQVLHCPYDYEKAKLIVKEMTDQMVLDLVDKGLVTDQLVLTIGYDIENLSNPNLKYQYKGEVTIDRYGRKVPKHAHGTANLEKKTSSTRLITNAVMDLYDRIVDEHLLVRRITITANKLVDEKSVKQEDEYQQLDLFTDYEAQRKKQAEEEEKLERERRMQEAMLSIKKKFGKNAVLKGMNLEEGATAKDRNEQIGGHKA